MAQGLGNTMKAIEGMIGKATERLLMSDLSNLTATAKQQLIEDVKRAVLDSNQFRADLAKIIADDFAASSTPSRRARLRRASRSSATRRRARSPMARLVRRMTPAGRSSSPAASRRSPRATR